jgi:hypothetical protein
LWLYDNALCFVIGKVVVCQKSSDNNAVFKSATVNVLISTASLFSENWLQNKNQNVLRNESSIAKKNYVSSWKATLHLVEAYKGQAGDGICEANR